MGLVTPGCLWGEAEGLEREGLMLTRLAIGESRLVPEGAGSSRICCEARMGVGAEAAGGPEEDEAEAARGPEEDEAEAACGLEEVESESFDLLDDRYGSCSVFLNTEKGLGIWSCTRSNLHLEQIFPSRTGGTGK